MNLNHLLESLKIPLYRTSKILQIIFNAVANQGNKVLKTIDWIINQSFPQHSSCIQNIAKDRGIIKLDTESEESFRKRVTYAYIFQRYSSTISGISDLIRKITNQEFQIREIYRETWILGSCTSLGQDSFLGSNQNRLYFIVNFSYLEPDDKYILEQIIDIYKPAHVGFHISIADKK